MTRVALYARYSSDNQSVSSIEDQFRIKCYIDISFSGEASELLSPAQPKSRIPLC